MSTAPLTTSEAAPFTLVSPDRAVGLPLGLRGPHQVANASLAMALAEALPREWRPDRDAIHAGLAAARIAGRFDRRGPYLFDVAHNPDGAAALAAAIRSEVLPRPLVAVVAVLKDKDWRQMLSALLPVVDRLVITRAPGAPAERAWNLEEVSAWCVASGVPATAESSLEQALRSAREAAGTVLVTGSFHTVGDAMALIPGFSPLG